MAVYDLEEQEQLDDLKAWWRRWGNTIAAVVIAVCVGVHRRAGLALVPDKQAEEAAVLYGAVSAGGARERRAEGARTRWRSSPTSSAAPATRRARRCS